MSNLKSRHERWTSVRQALELKINRILLDNMTVEMMAEAVSITKGLAKLEASGNVNLENVRRIAETGVDFISIGTLTHSAKTFDVSFDYYSIRILVKENDES